MQYVHVVCEQFDFSFLLFPLKSSGLRGFGGLVLLLDFALLMLCMYVRPFRPF